MLTVLAGMCLLDTTDGALMLSLYIQPAANFLPPKQDGTIASDDLLTDQEQQQSTEDIQAAQNHRDPVAFLYYSIVLTTLTVIVAIVIGIIQLLTLVLNVAEPTGRFWDGVQTAGDYYDAIGGGICGCFLVIGLLSVFVYKPWRRWIARRNGRPVVEPANEDGGYRDDFTDEEDANAIANAIAIANANHEREQGAQAPGKTGSQVTVRPAGGSSS